MTKKDKLFKIKHRESGLYWKGGGINSNNKSNKHIRRCVNGEYSYDLIDCTSERDALDVCFSKIGKTWSSYRAVKIALSYGHEPGLNSLLKKCVLIEIEILEKEVNEVRFISAN